MQVTLEVSVLRTLYSLTYQGGGIDLQSFGAFHDGSYGPCV